MKEYFASKPQFWKKGIVKFLEGWKKMIKQNSSYITYLFHIKKKKLMGHSNTFKKRIIPDWLKNFLKRVLHSNNIIFNINDYY